MTDILKADNPAWHALSPDETLELLDAHAHGLSNAQAAQQLQRFGRN